MSRPIYGFAHALHRDEVTPPEPPPPGEKTWVPPVTAEDIADILADRDLTRQVVVAAAQAMNTLHWARYGPQDQVRQDFRVTGSEVFAAYNILSHPMIRWRELRE